ncbi:MAG: DUF499 domain-containing protein [Desulfovibrio sp.]|nr:DUF499 domain-containing protein [Desulfovibrio sp.]
MTLPTIYDVCTPREDVLHGKLTESDFAADLAQVLKNTAPAEYQDSALFFANTHPTRGLKNLLQNVCQRLKGTGEQISSIFRLDTNFGGGKTHSLIALVHTAQGMKGVSNVSEFLDPDLIPTEAVQIAAFDGENADPVNGRLMGDSIRAYTPWGEIAFALGGKKGYETVQKSDEAGIAPGAETIRSLFGDRPTLILMDELAIYIRKQSAKKKDAGKQLTAFLSALFKAVESAPRVALVFTLAIGKKDKKAVDAYSEENQYIADTMLEAESVSARKATLLDPTEEDETVQVLRRRLFKSIDDNKAKAIVDEYCRLWNVNKEYLPSVDINEANREAFYEGYPLHPELVATLKEKTSTLTTFQRVRGMLRLLARTVNQLWRKHPSETYAIHLHHVDFSNSSIRQEILIRLQMQAYTPVLAADVTAQEGDKPSLAENIDREHFSGMPTYTAFVARTLFMHTLAFNDSLMGATENELRYAILAPDLELSFIDDARRRFIQESAYLDDRPNRPLRFMVEANLTRMIQIRERQVDSNDVRNRLKDEIKSIFKGDTFQTVFFPSVPNELEDAATDKPILAVMGFDGASVSIGDAEIAVPNLVSTMFRSKGADSGIRLYKNNIVFIVAEEGKIEDMKSKMRHRIALEDMRIPANQIDLADHQKEQLKEKYKKSEQEAAICIQQAYRHVFFPSRNKVQGASVDLGHTTVEYHNASANPGSGQAQLVRVLTDLNKLRRDGDNCDSALFMIERTPLKREGKISTLELRNEYRMEVALSMMVGDKNFIASIINGIETGEFVYQDGDLICGKGDPIPQGLKVSNEAFILTANYARENKIWPKIVEPEPEPEPDPKPNPNDEHDIKPDPDTDTNSILIPSSTSKIKEISHEGDLRTVLKCILEDARSAKFEAISSFKFDFSEARGGFSFLVAANSIQNCEKKITVDGSFQTEDGSDCSMNYEGSFNNVMEIKDFLLPQMRAASYSECTVSYFLEFSEGLSLSGDDADNFAAKLTKIGDVSVYVTATAKRK